MLPAPDASQWQAIGTVNRLFAQWSSNAALHQWRPEGADLAPALAQALPAPGGCLVQSPSSAGDATIEKRWARAIGNLGLSLEWNPEAARDE